MNKLAGVVGFVVFLCCFPVYTADKKTAASPLFAAVKTYQVKVSSEYLSPKVASLSVNLQIFAHAAPSDCASSLLGMCPTELSFTPILGENQYDCTASSGDACVITKTKGDATKFIKDYWPDNKNYQAYSFHAMLRLSQMDANGNVLTKPGHQTLNCLPASGTFDPVSDQITVFVAKNGFCVISMSQ